MRLIVLTLLIGFSAIVAAQGMPAGMQEAMDCMTSIDQQALEEFGRKGEKVAEEIKALCKQGDESGARDVGMDFVDELVNNEELKKMKECTELMRKAMPSMPIPEFPSAEEYEDETGSICENID